MENVLQVQTPHLIFLCKSRRDLSQVSLKMESSLPIHTRPREVQRRKLLVIDLPRLPHEAALDQVPAAKLARLLFYLKKFSPLDFDSRDMAMLVSM